MSKVKVLIIGIYDDDSPTPAKAIKLAFPPDVEIEVDELEVKIAEAIVPVLEEVSSKVTKES